MTLPERRDIPDDLSNAADEFLTAGRKYREFLKRNYKDRLAGVIYVVSSDGEMVLYSESERYTDNIRHSVPDLTR